MCVYMTGTNISSYNATCLSITAGVKYRIQVFTVLNTPSFGSTAAKETTYTGDLRLSFFIYIYIYIYNTQYHLLLG